VYGEDAQPVEARLETVNGVATWKKRELEDAELTRAAALFSQGYTVSDAATEMNIPRSRAGRLRKKAQEKGLFHEPKPPEQ
jgi:hypothetical protein